MQYDAILVGGGLAHQLLALRLRAQHPGLRLLVLEKREAAALVPSRTWSFHVTDLTASAQNWLLPLASRVWGAQSVRFPQLSRRLGVGYASIRSEDLDARVRAELSDVWRFGADVVQIEGTEVRTRAGECFTAPLIIDGRGAAPEMIAGRVAFQKFVGWEVELTEPHGLDHPVVMDATVEQRDGFRFVYLLPWSEKEVLVEDTRYSNSSEIRPEEFSHSLEKYIAERGWKIARRLRQEQAALPIPLYQQYAREGQSEFRLGLAGDLFHATTGYSLPDAVRVVDALTAGAPFTSAFVRQELDSYRQERRWRQAFYRLLNRLLFLVPVPEQRYRILQRFYHLPEQTICRFYRGETTWFDVMRIFSGRPPFAPWRALPHLAEVRV